MDCISTPCVPCGPCGPCGPCVRKLLTGLIMYIYPLKIKNIVLYCIVLYCIVLTGTIITP